jgi:hypothetical protein
MRKDLIILNSVKKQFEAEIEDDNAQIDLILDDPGVVDHEKSVAYTIHEIYHHLAVHETALELINSKLFHQRQGTEII